MRQIVLVAHNVRSAHNVGSLLRTADGLGVDKIYLTGYTPYPAMKNDERLPHIASKIHRQIQKTALGAEKSVNWQPYKELLELIRTLKAEGFEVVALEQTKGAISLTEFKPKKDIALFVGSEIGGLDKKILEEADACVEIPMRGKKESFNVAIAAAITLYHLRHM